MKRTFTLLALALVLTNAWASVKINETNFPDEWFRWSIQGLDENGDGTLSDAELAAVGLLDLSDVVNFKGIEYFYHVPILMIGGRNADEDERGKVTSFDFSKFKNLEWVDFGEYRYITSLDFSQNTKLKHLGLLDLNSLTEVKVPSSLENLSLRILPKLTAIDLSPCKSNLQQVTLETWGEDLYGGLKQLDLTDFKKLGGLYANGGPDCHYPLEQLILKGCDAMGVLGLDWVDLDELSLVNLPTIFDVNIANCAMKVLKVENCGELVTLGFQDNNIAHMNVKKCAKLGRIHANNNRLQELIVDESPNLWWIQAQDNQLTWLDLSSVVKDPVAGPTEDVTLEVDNQRPSKIAYKLSPTEVGLLVHERMDPARMLNLVTNGKKVTATETTIDGIRYLVFSNEGVNAESLRGKTSTYEYETKWPYDYWPGNSKDNNLPVNLYISSVTKHQATLTLSESVVYGKYAEPAPKAPSVTRSQDYDGKITYSSSNEQVVKVNAETGELTVVGAGTAVITVRGAETDYRLAPVTAYSVIIEKASPVFAFEKSEVTAYEGHEAPANPLTIQMYDGTVVYTSSNDSIATVNAQGIVTANVPGEVTITAVGPETSNCNKAVSAQYKLTIVVEGAGVSEIANGKLANGIWYDLQGRKSNAATARKGVYVVEGKKVLKK